MNIDKAMSTCIGRGIKVYPIAISKNSIFIESSNDGLIKRYSKELKSLKEINEALRKTYIFLAEKILKEN
tara:strand:- start:3955 stop:4164 length:210 start_codon:yes stop_codon:yes gene_type:complete